MNRPLTSAVAAGPGRIPALLCGGLLALLCLPPAVTAAEELRTRLDADDRARINSANMDYSGCLQEQAAGHVDALDDVRRIAGRAVEDCSGILEELEADLDERRIDPDYYHGIIGRIKSRAIRRILPAIMMYKAQADGAADSDQ